MKSKIWFLVPLLLLAGFEAKTSVTLPYTFSSGKTIKSAEVNADLSALANEINHAELYQRSFVSSVGLSLNALYSVTGSPVASSGTLRGTLSTQSKNKVFAGPSTGSDDQPGFRALVAADLPANSGTVTSVGVAINDLFSVTGSPVTTSGTITGVLSTQSANLVFSGPISGASGKPSFRSLVSGDIPSLSYVSSVALSLPSIFSVTGSPVTSSGTLTGTLSTQSANKVFAGATSGGASQPAFRSLVTADMPAGTGTVTSVAVALNDLFSVTGSPITISGTITGALSTQAANQVLAGGTSGGNSKPAFRSLVTADIPNLPASIITSGTLPVSLGGTGSSTLTANNVLLGNGGTGLNLVAPGANANVLTSNGTTWISTAPAAVVSTNSVTSSGTSIRVNSARIANPSGTCSVSAQTGTWIGSISHPTTGICTLNFVVGEFSSTPSCSATVEQVSNRWATVNQGSVTPSATQIAIETGVASTGAGSEENFYIICVGNH